MTTDSAENAQQTSILIVDDSPELLSVLRAMLESGGYRVWTATSGTEGLRLVRKQNPDLVFLDVVMPDLSGVEVCRRIKADPDLQSTFVVLISGQATEPDQKVTGFDAGADEYLAKPVPMQELLARVRTLARIQKAQETLRRAQGELEARVAERTAELARVNADLREDLTQRQRMAEALRLSEERFRLAARATNDGLWDMDLLTKQVWWSDTFYALFGYRVGEINPGADGWLALVHPDDRAAVAASFEAELNRGGDFWSCEYRFRRGDGTYAYVLDRLYIVRNAAGSPLRLAGSLTDITLRKRAEAKLAESEQQMRQAMKAGRMGTWAWDSATNALVHSEGIEVILGLPIEALPRTPEDFLPHLHPEDRNRVTQEIARSIESASEFSNEFRVVLPSGDVRWLANSGHAFRVETGRAVRLVGTIIDITGRKQAEDSMRELPKRIVEAQEAERRRVARDLHDSVNQLLASVRFRIQAVESKLRDRETGLWQETVRARECLDSAVQEVRRISRNLRPSELDDLGLLPAIRSAGEEFKERTGVAIELQTNSYLPKRLSTATELTLYRIFQEALNNIEKHAEAASVKVTLRREENTVVLSVKDDGKGFSNLSRAASRSKRAGNGLVNMRERAAFVGGRFAVSSVPRQGTEIIASLPLTSTSLNEPDAQE